MKPTDVLTHPTAGLTNPTAGLTNPTTDLMNPTAGLTNPTAGLTNPTTDLMNPTAGLTNPTTDLMNPTADLMKPTAGLTNPTAGLTNPTAGLTNPTADLMKPTAGLTRPTDSPTSSTDSPTASTDRRASSTGCHAGTTAWFSSSKSRLASSADRRMVCKCWLALSTFRCPGGQLALRIMRPAVLACALVAGCAGGERSGSDARVTIDSSGAYPVVRSAGQAAAWGAELMATIGADSGETDDFGNVRSVLLDSAGNVTVLDHSFVQLSEFDSTGAPRRRIGRKGEGPGEYLTPYSIARIDESLFLLDPGSSRMTRLDSTGAWSAQWTVERLTGGYHLRLHRTPPRGFWATDFSAGPDGRSRRTFVRYLVDGPRDTVPAHTPQLSSLVARCDRPDRGISFFGPPFGATPLVIPDADGNQVTGITTAYRLYLLNAAGDTLRSIEREADPAPITDAEWEEALEEFRDFKQQWPTAVCTRESWDRPAGKPPVQWIFHDDEGQLWVEVLTSSGLQYDIFGPDGALRATVRGLPASDEVDPSVVAGRIAFAVKGEDDTRAVRVYRLRK
jgi:hypothetical protein